MASERRLVAYACSLHASTDFREKLYKVFQSVLKLPGAGPNALKAASTLSQSRGIFKLLKCVNNIESYHKAASSEEDALLRGLKKAEAWLNTVVALMQDLISLDKLASAKIVSPRFVWWMNFLDLLLSLLLAGLAAHALRLLQAGNAVASSAKAQRQLLLLRLELGVRLGDALALLEATCLPPGTKRKLWPAPSPTGAVAANVISAVCAVSAVAIKKWPDSGPTDLGAQKRRAEEQRSMSFSGSSPVVGAAPMVDLRDNPIKAKNR